MPTGSLPNPYDPDELKRQAQIQQLGGTSAPMTSDDYYKLNQANAAKNPVTAPRIVDDAYKSEYQSRYGRPYATDTRDLYTDPKSGDRMVKTGAILAALGAGGVFGAGLAAGGATGALGAPAFATEGVGFSSAAGTGSAAAGAGATAKGVPWGKIGSAVTSLIPSGGVATETAQNAPTTTTVPPMNTGAPTTTPSTTTTVPTTTAAKTVAPVNSPPPPGWDAKNWADPNMHTVKYDAGRLLVGASKPSEIAARVASPEFQARFPGATFDGKDKIDFKGALSEGSTGSPVGLIDVLMAADQGSDSSNGLWWGFEPDDSTGDPLPNVKQTTQRDGQMVASDDNSTLAKIMAELQAAGKGTQSPLDRDAILALL